MTETHNIKPYKDASLQLAAIARRRKILIFAITFLGFNLTALYVMLRDPIYISHAQILFETTDNKQIKTDIAYLHAHEFAHNLKDKLTNNINFAQKNMPTAQHNAKNSPIKFRTLNLDTASLTASYNHIQKPQTSETYTILQKKLSALHVPDTYIAQLEYRDTTPRAAQKNLTTITQNYVKLMQHKHAKQNTAFNEILTLLEKNVVKAQKNYDAYIIKKQSIQTLSTKQPEHAVYSHDDLYRVSQKIIAAKQDLEPFLSNDNTLQYNANAPIIQNAKDMKRLTIRKKKAQKNYSALAQRYGKKHPKMRAAQNEINAIRTELKQAGKRIMRNTKNRYDRLVAQKIYIKNTAQHITHTPPIPTPTAITDTHVNTLKQHIQNAKTLHDEFKKHAQLQDNAAQKQPVRILSSASLATHQAMPSKVQILFTGTLCALFLGMISAIIAERHRNRFLSGKQLEGILGLPCYALIPELASQPNTNITDYTTDHPESQIAEAVRALRLTIKLRAQAQERDHKVITITSSLPDEGKSTLCAWLARLAARSGERVIVIDTDLRRPCLHHYFNQSHESSLVDYLTDRKKLEEIIDTSDPSGAHLIHGCTTPNSALDLLASDKMEHLIRSLRKGYDLIILDSPAAMAMPDAQALARLSDQLLYLVAWNKTEHEVVHNGISQFQKSGINDIATVLTHIDLKKHISFGYGTIMNSYGYNQPFSPH